jgi:large subunit ribosomal protein L32
MACSLLPVRSNIYNMAAVCSAFTGSMLCNVRSVLTAICSQTSYLADSLLLAVPKQKVTHARKRERMTSKWLKNVQNIVRCPQCGNAKAMHTICWACYKRLKFHMKGKAPISTNSI